MIRISVFFIILLTTFSSCVKPDLGTVNSENCEIAVNDYFNVKWTSALDDQIGIDSIKWFDFGDYIGILDINTKNFQVVEKEDGNQIYVGSGLINTYSSYYFYNNKCYENSGSKLHETDPVSGITLPLNFEGDINRLTYYKNKAFLCIENENGDKYSYVLFDLDTHVKEVLCEEEYGNNENRPFITGLSLFYNNNKNEFFPYIKIKNSENYKYELYRILPETKEKVLIDTTLIQEFSSFIFGEDQLYLKNGSKLINVDPLTFKENWTMDLESYFSLQSYKFYNDELILIGSDEVIDVDIASKNILWFQNYPSQCIYTGHSGLLPHFTTHEPRMHYFKDYLLSTYEGTNFSLLDIKSGEFYCENCKDNEYINGLNYYSDGDFIYTITKDKNLVKYGE
ncbi:MAG: hypothetical protein R2771_04260 [Saprospiraceae bacterium]